MKRGFTLLELVVVIIIIGILATLGVAQYRAVIERARGAEARGILGYIRSQAIGYRLENDTIVTVTDLKLSMGTGLDEIPTVCKPSHFFKYSFTAEVDPIIVVTATRCGEDEDGKPPQGVATNTLILTSNLSTGEDTWTGTGGY